MTQVCRKMVFKERDYPSVPCGRQAKWLIKDRMGDTRFDTPMCGRHAVAYKKQGYPYQPIASDKQLS